MADAKAIGGKGGGRAAASPAEVTNAQLATAIRGTSNNSNAVAALDTPFADPDARSVAGGRRDSNGRKMDGVGAVLRVNFFRP